MQGYFFNVEVRKAEISGLGTLSVCREVVEKNRRIDDSKKDIFKIPKDNKSVV